MQITELCGTSGDRELLSRAIGHAQRGDKLEARRLLAETVRLNPDNEKAWLWRASTAETRPLAVSYLEQLLRINPGHAVAQEWLRGLAPARPEAAPEAALKGRDPGSAKSGVAAPRAGASDWMSAVSGWRGGMAASARKRMMCPFCQTTVEEDPCPKCRAVLAFRPDLNYDSPGRDPKAMKAAMQGLLASAGAADSYEVQMAIALAHLNLKDSCEAAVALTRALALNPGDTVVSNQLLLLMARPLILVVDDCAVTRTLVANALDSAGYRVRRCASAAEALNAVRLEAPRMALLDISMPVMDGYELCRAMRATEATRQIPIMMLSGHGTIFDKVKGRIAGSTDHITKPFCAAPVLQKIAGYVRGPK